MGIKGKIAWSFMTDKVSKIMFQAQYRETQNLLMATSASVDEINVKMQELGFRIGETLLMDYADRIREHAANFSEFASTLKLAYKVNMGQEITHVAVSNNNRTLKFTDDNCLLCAGVVINDMPGLQYCNVVSGVFDAVMKLRGFNAESYQESCRAVGDSTCTWTLNLRE